MSRTYHNVTAYYNIYFNGQESMKKAQKTMEESFDYNYSRLLPVFLYDDEAILQSISSYMDRTIEKGAKLINTHSITAKPEKTKGVMTPKEKAFYNKNEYCKWVDDAYLMIGKGHFYQQNYSTAVYTFDYILRDYDDVEVKYSASVWLVRAYVKNDEFKEAVKRLAIIEEEEDFKEHIDARYYATCADLFIKQEQYQKAINKLNKAIDHEKDKKKRLRYTYLLAQLYQKTGQGNQAVDTYEKVIKMNPPYEMTFNANISLASAFEVGSGRSDMIEEQLLTMLKDEKNIEFQDQIYFALGELEYKKGNINQALEYYHISAAKSVDNDNQKALSYLSVADIYYDRRNYRKAEMYYDSTSAFLRQDYPDYKVIKKKKNNLNRLIQVLNVVETQDSLQMMANMDEKERLNYIDKAIASYNQKEAELKAKENERRQDQMYYRSRLSGDDRQMGGSEGGKWYFYNPSSVGFGKSEFRAKWGTRKLEDNWRRSNKKIVDMDMFAEDSEQQEGMTEEGTKKLSPASRDYYLQHIPTNDSLMALSHKKIQQALFSAGSVYKNQFKDYSQAINSFEEIMDRYPNATYTAMACYQLYDIGDITGDNILKNKYKQIIINRFPESVYAKVIKDPDYLSKLKTEKNEALVFYENTYQKYRNNLYADVIQDADYGRTMYADEAEIVNKLGYLKILSIGSTQDVRIFRDSLEAFIEKYPRTETAEDAENILAYIDHVREDIKEEKEEEIALEIYHTTDEQEHYFCVAGGGNIDVNQMIFNIIAYNLDHHDTESYEVNAEKLGEGEQIVVTRAFENKEQAMEYYRNIVQAEDVFDDFEDMQLHRFVISKQNFAVLFDDTVVERYIKFFRNNYLKQSD